ncbi:hypothetical protein D9757_002641 [Collybiopsis confluens]|uniref:Deacetylase sirtuin-type domain-containing protein n=1 Tax=Collybiopsis confluens TaxID=2823264 RepID=A0A8H5MDP9_9AGAR|nr:hypothetical protein D9757_002641 [Collybiopsis confluens]
MAPVTLDLEESKSDFSIRRALSDLSLAVAKCKKVVVVTGAGISCSSGIPDFRSSDGLYNLVKFQFPDVVLKGRDLFDASLFRDSTSTAVFYAFISQLKQIIDQAQPTPTHDFLKVLESKGKLLRSYTQNIDGMEERVGLVGNTAYGKGEGKGKGPSLKQSRNVKLHGDIHRVRCQACSAEYPCTQEHLDFFTKGTSPDCPECLARSNARVARSARALRVGSLRPAIVLYDEPHPLGDDIGMVQGLDIARKPDMLIIMGTSLKVHGLKKLVKEFAKAVHTHKSSSTSSSSSAPLRATKGSSAKSFAGKVIFVNKTPPSSEWADVIDYHVSGTTDDWTQRVVEEWKKMRPSDWEVQQTLTSAPALFKLVKESSNAAQVNVKSSGQTTFKPRKDPKKKVVSRTHEGDQNIPPPLNSDFMVLSTPDAHRFKSTKPAQTVESPLHMVVSPTPLSPSKRARPQSHSHYGAEAQTALEASPSKRRIKNLSDVGDDPCQKPVGTILFGKTSIGALASDDEQEDEDDDLDVPMRSPPKVILRPLPKSRTEVKPLPKARSLAKVSRTRNIDSDVFA